MGPTITEALPPLFLVTLSSCQFHVPASRYKKLLGYLIAISILFGVIAIQWDMSGTNQEIYTVIEGNLFGIDTNTRDYTEKVSDA